MKKIILSLAVAAFIMSGSVVIATTNSNSETLEIVQDGKKKSKATKKEECGDKKSTSVKGECNDKAISKKSCCSDGKSAKKKTTSPEKK